MGNTIYKKEQIVNLLQLFEKSGLSQRQFAAQNHIPEQTFNRWFVKAKKRPAEIKPQFTQICQEKRIKNVCFLKFPNGVELHFQDDFDPKVVAKLLKLC